MAPAEPIVFHRITLSLQRNIRPLPRMAHRTSAAEPLMPVQNALNSAGTAEEPASPGIDFDVVTPACVKDSKVTTVQNTAVALYSSSLFGPSVGPVINITEFSKDLQAKRNQKMTSKHVSKLTRLTDTNVLYLRNS